MPCDRATTKYIEVVCIPANADHIDEPTKDPEFSNNDLRCEFSNSVLRCEESIIDCPSRAIVKNVRFQLTARAKKILGAYEALEQALAGEEMDE